MKPTLVLIGILVVCIVAAQQTFAQTSKHGRIMVSDNNRFLKYEDGTPFFYLGDTAWELFHRCSREEAEAYLRNRAEKGYTVIQAVILAELEGLNVPNVYGDNALNGNNPETPNENYFAHVDFIIDMAETYGLVIGLLPTWGDKVANSYVFNESNANTYGHFLGQRYKDKKNIIWILGGDRDWKGYENTWRSMAKGIAVGVSGTEDYSKVTMTLHPCGGKSSSEWVHNDTWLDFNMQQNGHCANIDAWNRIGNDYNRSLVKPVIDGEPLYEEHPICFNPAIYGTSSDFHCRRFLYHDLFAGAFGHTYGCHAVWQMYTRDRAPINRPLRPWHESLNLPGAFQMQYARYLIESRPFFSRIPDQSIIISSTYDTNDRISATRDANGTYAFIYSESGKSFTVDMKKLSGNKTIAHWYDPRTGNSYLLGSFSNNQSQEFTPPSKGGGNEWVLVLDDASKNYAMPTDKQPDFIAPSKPSGLKTSSISSTTVELSWLSATDNNKVAGYQIFTADGKLLGATATNKYLLKQLIPTTEYNLTIKAVDAGLNYSVSSEAIKFSTKADAKITQIKISPDNTNLVVGKPIGLSAQILPETVANKNVIWECDNTKIAFIEKNGRLIPLKPGTCKVTARSISQDMSIERTYVVKMPDDVYRAKHTTNSIKIDGKLEEAAWNNLQAAKRELSGTINNTLQFEITWDGSYIYVAAIVTDSNIVTDSEMIYEDDAVELYFDGNCDKSGAYDQFDRQIILAPGRPVYDASGKTNGINSAIINTANGYSFEVAIPWSNLSINPDDQWFIGFDISNIDDDGKGRDGLLMWRGTTSNWQKTESFGTVIFEK